MHTKVGASPAYVLSQLSTAVVGAACFVASIALVNSAKTALFEPSLLISPSHFSWLSTLSFDVQRDIAFPQTVRTPVIESIVSTNVDHELKKIFKLEARAKKEHRRIWAHLSKLVKLGKQAKPAQSEALAIADSINVSQAATKLEIEPPVIKTEAEKLQGVQAALMSQFRLSMNEVHPDSLNTQIAQAATTQPMSTSDLGLDDVPSVAKPQGPSSKGPRHTGHRAVAVSEREKTDSEPQAVLSGDADQPKQALSSVATNLSTSTYKDTLKLSAASEVSAEAGTAAVNTHSDPSRRRPSIDALAKAAEKSLGMEDFATPPTDDDGYRPIQVTETESDETPADDGAASAPSLPVSAHSETMSFMGNTLVLPPEYPSANTPNRYPSHGAPAVTTQQTNIQVAAAQVQTPPSFVLPVPQTPRRRTIASTTPSTGPSPASANGGAAPVSTAMSAPMSLPAGVFSAPPVLAPEPAPRASFVEAFDWNRSVTDAQAEILTREDAFEAYGQSQQGWRISRAADHWPSVFWNRPGAIPMLSKNAAKMLSLKTGALLQEEAGIIIAKAPAGWSLEFSGRAEHPLIFSESNLLLATDSVDEARYYVFLNASPGAQILYLVKSGETAVLTLPVFGGMVSFADMSQPEKRAIVGRVLDTSSGRATAGVRVQVVGSGQTAVTNGAGAFHIDPVITFGSQAVFIETESTHGYPHRYKVNPKAQKQALFLIGDEQIHDWIGQLEGGISSESGLVVGALPTIAAADEDKKLIPSIKTLATDPTLVPEAYTVSHSGQLMVKSPMTGSNSRLVGIQVPEGPALVQLTDKNGRILWSELLVISPRVLSVVGPY